MFTSKIWRIVPLLVIAILLITTLAPFGATYADPAQRTAILVGFGWNQEGAWLGEVGPYMEVLENPVDVSGRAPLCNGPIFEGTIYDQPVLVVVAGTAKVRMATCVQNLLAGFDGEISEVILTAIAGISPMRGGMFDAQGNFRHDEIAEVGDICISYTAVDFDLQFYATDPPTEWWSSSWKSPSPVGSKELADELIAAAAQVSWPEVPEGPFENISKYHGSENVRPARAWGYTECIENTDDLFWHGVIGDARAREIGAETITQVVGVEVGPEDIVITTSMEAVPMLSVVQWWNEAYGTNIKAAYIRGASNFDHPWPNPDGSAAVTGRESIESGMETGGGVDYSAVTEALPMIKMLELRSKSQ